MLLILFNLFLERRLKNNNPDALSIVSGGTYDQKLYINDPFQIRRKCESTILILINFT